MWTVYLSPGQEKITSSVQNMALGARGVMLDGRVFRYGRAGGTALDPGKLMQESVVVTGHTKDLVAAVTAIGAQSITLTNSTTAITKDMYKEGYCFVNSGPGAGQQFVINTHPAESTGSGTCAFTLQDNEKVQVALTAASRIGLRKNLYDGVLVNPIAATGVPCGVTPIAFVANYYGWFQTWGVTTVLTNGTVIRGKTVIPGATTPGSVDVTPLNSVDGSSNEPAVGVVMSVAASTEYSLVFLTIAP